MKIAQTLILIVLMISLAACGQGAATAVRHVTRPKVSQALRQEILKDAREDVRGIESIAEDPGPLAKYLSGQALDDMTNELTQNRAQGKTKIRRYSNATLSLTHYTKGIAGVTYGFDDGSYYVLRDAPAKRSLAISDRRRLSLALAKKDGRWKIIRILQSASEDSR